MDGRGKKWAAYSIALAGLLVVFFLILPGIVKRQAVRLITQGSPDAAVAVESAALSLPAGIRLGNVAITFKGGRSIEMRKVDIQARLLGLLGGKLSLAVDSALYGGRLNGSISFLNRFSSSGPFAAYFSFEGIKAGDCRLLNFGRQLSGRLSGHVELAGDTTSPLQAEGSMQARLVDGMLPLAPNRMGLELMAFENLEAEASLGGGILTINRLEIRDRAAAGGLQGQVRIDADSPGNSQLQLRGHVTFSFDPGRRHTAVLLGTFSSPALDIM
jgi:type II secretion system protein N